MAEALAAVGALASSAQILSYIFQAAEAVAKFCDTVRDAPSNLRRIRDKLRTLHEAVVGVCNYLQAFDDDLVLPLDLRAILVDAIGHLKDDLDKIQARLETLNLKLGSSTGRRLKWAAIDCRTVDKLLARLKESECTLDRVIQLVNL
jgi:hypothetical protein